MNVGLCGLGHMANSGGLSSSRTCAGRSFSLTRRPRRSFSRSRVGLSAKGKSFSEAGGLWEKSYSAHRSSGQ
jgi:hypothetical protein